MRREYEMQKVAKHNDYILNRHVILDVVLVLKGISKVGDS